MKLGTQVVYDYMKFLARLKGELIFNLQMCHLKKKDKSVLKKNNEIHLFKLGYKSSTYWRPILHRQLSVSPPLHL